MLTPINTDKCQILQCQKDTGCHATNDSSKISPLDHLQQFILPWVVPLDHVWLSWMVPGPFTVQ